jgi:hypothetical protein
MRFGLGFRGSSLVGGENAVESFRAFFSGETRLIVAFRHPYGDEPQVLAWAILGLIRREALRLGLRLPKKPRALFIHGYEVPRWGGALVRWILPRMGALPVRHERTDKAGMDSIRKALCEGEYPIALAPEGQTSYASERLPRIENGTVRLGFWCADELAKCGRSERVEILPVSVHHRYFPESRASLAALVGKLEIRVGLDRTGDFDPETLSRIRDRVLDLAEAFYRGEGVALPLAAAGASPGNATSVGSAPADLSARPAPGAGASDRIAALVQAGLSVSERILGLRKGAGDAIERMYRVRGACWKAIYREDWTGKEAPSPLARALADRKAGEAWYAMRHMELCDLAWYLVDAADPPPSGAPFHLVVEYAQNLHDLAARLSGGAISDRLAVRPRRAVLVFGKPMELASKLADFRADHRAATQSATAELASVYLECIRKVRDDFDSHDTENRD